MRTSLLLLVTALGWAVSPAVALDVPTTMTSSQLVLAAEKDMGTMTTIQGEVGKDLADAENKGDEDTAECIRLRMNKISALVSVSSLAQSEMNLALSKQQLGRAEHEYRKIEVAVGFVTQFQSEVNGCTGEGAVSDATSSTDSGPSNVGTDDTQGLGISDGVVGVDPPGTTPFEY